MFSPSQDTEDKKNNSMFLALPPKTMKVEKRPVDMPRSVFVRQLFQQQVRYQGPTGIEHY